MRKLIVLLSIVAAVGAGCGDSGGTGSGSVSGSGTSDAAPPVKLTGTTNNHGVTDVTGKSDAKVKVELDDFYFGPTFIHAKPGQSVTVELANEGTTTHTFTTSAGGTDESLAKDAKKTVTVTAPSSGVLVFFCRFHQSQGMQGAVYLNEGDSASASGGSTGGGGAGSSTSTSAYNY